jgi:prepilin-type processing-associated H-X9-DG protein
MTSIWLLRGTFARKDDPNNIDEDARFRFGVRGIALCPMTAIFSGRPGFTITHNKVLIASGTNGSTFGTWEMTTPPPTFRGSYGYNDYVFEGFSKVPRHDGSGLDVLSMRSRSEIPLMLDSTDPFMRPQAKCPPPATEDANATNPMHVVCINRHSGSVNGLFLDWSVRKIGLKELWTLKWGPEFDRAGPWTKAGGVKPEAWPAWMRKLKDY